MNQPSSSIRDFFAKMFVSASPEADEINKLFIDFSWIAFGILMVVAFMVIGGIVIYRSKKRKGEPKQVYGHTGLEITWTIIPFIIVTILFFMSLKVMKDINKPHSSGQEPDIIIIAHQWWWDMRYPKEGVITANELHIPVGEKWLMRIESADVIHSWWVPALGRKTDAVPGRPNYSWISADSVGEYEGTCSEYCGAEHAWMRIKVVAQTPEDFRKWIQHQQKPAIRPADSLGIAGEKLFQRSTCGSCHAIKGTAADSHIAPDLTHMASRETLLSGMLVNNPKNLRKWLKDPQKVKEGAHMPNFLLSKQELNAFVDYLEQLK